MLRTPTALVHRGRAGGDWALQVGGAGRGRLRPKAAFEQCGGCRCCHLHGQKFGGRLYLCLWSGWLSLGRHRITDHTSPSWFTTDPCRVKGPRAGRGESTYLKGADPAWIHTSDPAQALDPLSQSPHPTQEIACQHIKEKTLLCSHRSSSPTKAVGTHSSYRDTPS